MSIRPLPRDAADKIKSAAAITSLNDVACGLLSNSLDARCSKVKIHVDYALGNCTVEDNGLGIEPSEFKQDGGLAKMHHTSKTPPNPGIHGGHGNFLAHVAAFSLLTVTSHHYRHVSHHSLSIHNGSSLSRPPATSLEQRFDTFSHGTRVSVRNLFGSMPVRVKQRGILFSDRSGIDKEWASLILEITGLLLGWPADLSVLLQEGNTHKEIRLKSGVPEIVSRTSRLFLQASLADSDDLGSWVPVSASSRRARIKGCISTNPAATKRSQIMNLGIRPISNSFGTNVLYEEANKIFRDSHFGLVEPEEAASGGNTDAKAKPRKGIERWPKFYLEIHLLGHQDMLGVDDVLGDSQHILQSILELLKVVCYGFLTKHHLQPKAIRVPSNTAEHVTAPARNQSTGTSKGRTEFTDHTPTRQTTRVLGRQGADRPSSPFDQWNRGKVGWATPPAYKGSGESMAVGASHGELPTASNRLLGRNGKLLRKPFDDPEALTPVESRSEAYQQPESTVQDPENLIGSSTEQGETQPKSHRILESRPKSTPQPWLDDVLRSWKNPVFEIVEPPVPKLTHDSANPNEVQPRKDVSKFFGECTDVQFEAASLTLNSRLSRTLLADAEVIGQVDKKFLLLRLPVQKQDSPTATSALIMLDQHAADERCRLEGLMAEYFDSSRTHGHICAKTETLERPIVFEASGREAELINRCQDHFKIWGVLIKAQGSNEEQSSAVMNHNVEVTSLPPSILERCQAEPRLAIELIRKEIWKLEDGKVPPPPTHEEGRLWPSSFHNCPQGILELLHSRSCRSAIMFNDELSMDECRELLQRLARCAYPFQCAHGRPSMAPVVDIGSGTGRLGRWERQRQRTDIQQWKDWLET